MSARPTGELLGELIAVLADACADDEARQRAKRTRRGPSAAAKRRAGRYRALAASVARCASAGDWAGADRLLVGPRPHSEWRGIALALAAYVSPALAARPDDAALEGGMPGRDAA